MINPDCRYCPSCLVPKFGLKFTPIMKENSEGTLRPAGWCNRCDCGALTQSPSTGQYNLRTAVAKEFGIKRTTTASVQARIQPVIRRKAKKDVA